MASASAVTNDDVRTAIDIKEEENRVAKEIELYFDIKRYLTLLNKEVLLKKQSFMSYLVALSAD